MNHSQLQRALNLALPLPPWYQGHAIPCRLMQAMTCTQLRFFLLLRPTNVSAIICSKRGGEIHVYTSNSAAAEISTVTAGGLLSRAGTIIIIALYSLPVERLTPCGRSLVHVVYLL